MVFINMFQGFSLLDRFVITQKKKQTKKTKQVIYVCMCLDGGCGVQLLLGDLAVSRRFEGI